MNTGELFDVAQRAGVNVEQLFGVVDAAGVRHAYPDCWFQRPASATRQRRKRKQPECRSLYCTDCCGGTRTAVTKVVDVLRLAFEPPPSAGVIPAAVRAFHAQQLAGNGRRRLLESLFDTDEHVRLLDTPALRPLAAALVVPDRQLVVTAVAAVSPLSLAEVTASANVTDKHFDRAKLEFRAEVAHTGLPDAGTEAAFDSLAQIVDAASARSEAQRLAAAFDAHLTQWAPFGDWVVAVRLREGQGLDRIASPRFDTRFVDRYGAPDLCATALAAVGPHWMANGRVVLPVPAVVHAGALAEDAGLFGDAPQVRSFGMVATDADEELLLVLLRELADADPTERTAQLFSRLDALSLILLDD